MVYSHNKKATKGPAVKHIPRKLVHAKVFHTKKIYCKEKNNLNQLKEESLFGIK